MVAAAQCAQTSPHNPHGWSLGARSGVVNTHRYCNGLTDRQAARLQPDEGAPRQAGTVTQMDGLETSLRSLAARYDDHADDVDLGPKGDPARRAAAQLRLVAVLHREGIYDRTTAYVWLQSGRRLLVELLDLHEIDTRG